MEKKKTKIGENKMKVKESGIYVHKWRGKKTHYKLTEGQEIKENDLPKNLIKSLKNSKIIEDSKKTKKIKEVKENG